MTAQRKAPAGAKKVRRRLDVLREARRSGHVSGVCRRQGISRTLFYQWKRRLAESGPAGLADRSRRPHRLARRSPSRIVGIVLALRLTWGWGPPRIRDFLARVHGVRMSAPGIWKILHRLAIGRRSQIDAARNRVSGRHRSDVDPEAGRTLVLSVRPEPVRPGRRSRRFVYEARDAAAGFTIIQLAEGREANATAFVDVALSLFPLRVEGIETEEKPEFTGYFHWHVLSLGLEHVFGKGPLADHLPMRGDALMSLGADRLLRGMLVGDDPRLQRTIAEWEGLTGTADSGGSRSR
jgi:transposase